MSGVELIFYLLSGVAVITAAGVVFARRPVHSAFFLVISFLNVAGLYVMLGAEFLAAVQVIVYTGAILVVFLFVIMLVRPEDLGDLSHGSPVQTVVAWILGLALFGEVASVITSGIVAGSRGQVTQQQIDLVGGNTQAIGRILYSEYLLPFEVASLVLLVAVIAAIVLGLPERIIGREQTGLNISLGHPAHGDPFLLEPPDDDEDDYLEDEDEESAPGRGSGVITVGRE